jgi:hypothetical protein
MPRIPVVEIVNRLAKRHDLLVGAHEFVQAGGVAGDEFVEPRLEGLD